ncbi:unnamed protein product [Lymnaea stagnalis]|uniref:EF-hand domain-containing protein n=1 Tax=Lymnaea stagnalis TaxID=6523 RepID=A0AAV2IAT1_LYMST
MSNLIILLVCLPALTLCAIDWAAVSVGSFAKIDSNNDGSLEKPEVERYFKQTYDTNGDDKVTKQEYVAVVTAANSDHNLVRALTGLFDDLDFNNDDVIDKNDNDKLFDLIDRNNNNRISQLEYTTWFELTINPVVG